MTINDLLENENLTLYRLSKETKIPLSSLVDVFSGKSNLLECRGKTLLGLAKRFNVSIEYLLELEPVPYDYFCENEIPTFLKESIKRYNRHKNRDKFDAGCYFQETASDINVCEVEQLITKEQANYLRKKYLGW